MKKWLKSTSLVKKAFNGLVGQVMKAAKGKANPAQVNELMKKLIG
jgi:aspartyl-tRNA(Asn)/glutamyl-tRNA(Gln) amidotransferase subunit B